MTDPEGQERVEKGTWPGSGGVEIKNRRGWKMKQRGRLVSVWLQGEGEGLAMLTSESAQHNQITAKGRGMRRIG